MSFSLSRALPNSCKNPAKNFLINFSFKLSKFQCLSCSAITRMGWVLNLPIVNITVLIVCFDHDLQLACNLIGFHHHCPMHYGCFLEAKLREESSGTS